MRTRPSLAEMNSWNLLLDLFCRCSTGPKHSQCLQHDDTCSFAATVEFAIFLDLEQKTSIELVGFEVRRFFLSRRMEDVS